MSLLLDTHVYLWFVKGDSKLSKLAQELILEAHEVYISSISIWEIAIKVKLGKIEANIADLITAISRSGFLELPLTMRHVSQVDQLIGVHQDPFDRILIAQAMSEPLKFLTADEKLKSYSELVKII